MNAIGWVLAVATVAAIAVFLIAADERDDGRAAWDVAEWDNVRTAGRDVESLLAFEPSEPHEPAAWAERPWLTASGAFVAVLVVGSLLVIAMHSEPRDRR